MKKISTLLTSGILLLSVLNVANVGVANKTDKTFKFTSDIKENNDYIGRKNAKKDDNASLAKEFVTGTSEYVSPCISQASNDHTSLRLVAGLKGDVSEKEATVKGYAGFHVSYTKKDNTKVDQFIKVENYYLSMIAGGVTYYANDLSSKKDEAGAKSLDSLFNSLGLENKGYNLFISLDFQDISEADITTEIKVQPYYVNENNEVSYSSKTKITSAVGYSLYFIKVNDKITTMTRNPESGETTREENGSPVTVYKDEYMVTDLSLVKGDKVTILDSYMDAHMNYQNEGITSGEEYTAPRNGKYSFYYKTKLNTFDQSDTTYIVEATPYFAKVNGEVKELGTLEKGDDNYVFTGVFTKGDTIEVYKDETALTLGGEEIKTVYTVTQNCRCDIFINSEDKVYITEKTIGVNVNNSLATITEFSNTYGNKFAFHIDLAKDDVLSIDNFVANTKYSISGSETYSAAKGGTYTVYIDNEDNLTLVEGMDLYLKPNSNWLQANARFSVYLFGDGNTWKDLTAATDGYYKFTLTLEEQATYTSLIFCRMNPDKNENNWDNRWNQIGNLTISNRKTELYSIAGDTWDIKDETGKLSW